MTTVQESDAPAERDPRLLEQTGLSGMRSRLSSGDFGSLPVVVGLIVIWAVFQIANHNFLTPRNLTNLGLQAAATGTIAVGIVLVLLLGEIDLSVGSVSGVTSAIMIVLFVSHGWNPWAAMLAAIVVGVTMGLLHGVVFTKVGVPSFVVTLAGLIGWAGLQLFVLGKEGSINLPSGNPVDALTSTFFVPAYGWGLAVIAVVLYALSALYEARSRTRAGLEPPSMVGLLVRVVGVAIVCVVTVAVLNADRGMPMALLLFLLFVVVLGLVTKRTRYGRHIYAVGGNLEAARRAGIRVDAIRISVFALSALMATLGGLLAASRLGAVTQSSGGNDILLNAIAAAVIGGTSLFGGRGSVWSALLGILVIQSISNGLDLTNQPSSVKFMITGAVLLIAVALDALGRRGRTAAGRA
jgi:D-xylose transport system permease protein